MDDNARPHWISDALLLLENENITQMVWVTFFPDLNTREHVLGALRRRLVAQIHLPGENLTTGKDSD
ncbi:hypothetical protein TNCV_4055191 [Trichonephila clavipes]|nr:hypothetical protein TNCV_4055191 [Trichonephila clavipes]